jgi:hypothetical protein
MVGCILQTGKILTIKKSEKKLSGIIYERGVDDKGFVLIRSKGDQALFGGFSNNDMKSIPMILYSLKGFHNRSKGFLPLVNEQDEPMIA